MAKYAFCDSMLEEINDILAQGGSYFDVEETMLEYGLEMDYIHDVINEVGIYNNKKYLGENEIEMQLDADTLENNVKNIINAVESKSDIKTDYNTLKLYRRTINEFGYYTEDGLFLSFNINRRSKRLIVKLWEDCTDNCFNEDKKVVIENTEKEFERLMSLIS